MTPEIEHRRTCVSPNVSVFTGERGDKLARCLTCSRYCVLEAAPAPPADVRAPVPSSFRCGAHPTEPVTWKGTGCPTCTQEQVDARNRRAARRKAITQQKEEEAA